LEPISAREWGRRQAAASPVWSEEKWQRIGAILGADLSRAKDRTHDDAADQDHEHEPPSDWAVAA
jgi:hypothetical protein